jgi:hypothetical protein
MKMAAGDHAAMRASDNDRSRAQAHLNEAFAEGRLSQQEWDERATALVSAVTYGELVNLTADLPGPGPGWQLDRPSQLPLQPFVQQRTSGLAIGALACGIGQAFVGPPAAIAAIVLGHNARRRIRQTGEQGDGLAVAGLVLGYLGIAGIALFIALIALAAIKFG